MLSLKVNRLCAAVCLLLLVILCCKSDTTEAGRVIFYAPRTNQIYTGQILSAQPKKEPCPRCQMRDHRGRCRRIIKFNPVEKDKKLKKKSETNMNTKQLCGLLIISIILMSAMAPLPTSAKRVIFYRKDGTVLHSQLLVMDKRKAPCPKGLLRDHRNRCRRAVTFSR
ncbi:uncharacterized protein LOC133321967, partial [Musca vetustissima]|uniref:uncharacterized protein LOC133321967 n=1 Tax=Musca vetustissima TaxID=27455 RepID=UPI002AB7622F